MLIGRLTDFDRKTLVTSDVFNQYLSTIKHDRMNDEAIQRYHNKSIPIINAGSSSKPLPLNQPCFV